MLCCRVLCCAVPRGVARPMSWSMPPSTMQPSWHAAQARTWQPARRSTCPGEGCGGDMRQGQTALAAVPGVDAQSQSTHACSHLGWLDCHCCRRMCCCCCRPLTNHDLLPCPCQTAAAPLPSMSALPVQLSVRVPVQIVCQTHVLPLPSLYALPADHHTGSATSQ
jgi:hypothetical protein